MAGDSKRAVVAAIAGNMAIAAIKFAAAAVTGSSAMISEGIHSLVDTGNGGLLLHGLRRSRRPADRQHPFGHGGEVYFWSLIVAVSIFGIGGGMSIYEGITHIRHPVRLEDPTINYVVLALAAVFEAMSFRVAWREFRAAKGDRRPLAAIHHGKDPSLFTVLFEDTAALLGLAVAFFGVLLGFPVLKRKFDSTSVGTTAWGCSIGLIPFSSVGYRMKTVDSTQVYGTTTSVYEGDGGLNQVYFGNAFRPVKNLSVGVNASLLFGSLGLNRTLLFSNTSYHSIYAETDAVISDLKFDLGMQYHGNIGKKSFFNFGVTYSNPAKLKSHNDTLIYTYFVTSSNATSILDTISNVSEAGGYLNLPSSLGIGFVFGNRQTFLAGIDYSMQDWSKYTYFGQSDSLANSKQISAGLQFSPYNAGKNKTPKYWQKVQYRVGFRYADTYLKLRNTQLKETAVTFGFGLPLRKTKTMIHVSFEMGKRGTVENDLIEEKFGRVSVAFSLFDKWFYKKRFE